MDHCRIERCDKSWPEMSDGDVALALVRHVRQTATCTVCLLPFRSPYLLPACLHTFCRQCIQRLDADCESLEGMKVLCPQCSQESLMSLPDGKETAVKDYFANKLLESTGHLLSLNQCEFESLVTLLSDLQHGAVVLFLALCLHVLASRQITLLHRCN